MNYPESRQPVDAKNRRQRGISLGLLGLVLLVSVFLMMQLPALAQSASGTISGTVADKSGAVIPKAKVILKNSNSGVTRETISNGSGVYTFPSVLPGTYEVTITTSGFQPWELKEIVLNQGGSVSFNAVMQVEGTKQEVEVAGMSESVVPVDTGQASQTLGRQLVEDLSIVGRDAAELIKIMPGMAMATGLSQSMWNSYTTASNTGPIGAFSAAGTQPNGAMTMSSDGANLLDPGNQGTQTANINQNQVAEVSILTSAYGAEFAKGPVTFQAIGKSGGSRYHGGAYLYARDGTFNAVDSYNKSQGGSPLNDRFFYPGGDFGGPVMIPKTNFNKNRDKLFFYTAYEYMKQQPAGTLRNYFVPTAEMMNGNFSPDYLKTLGSGFANARSAANVVPGGNATSNDGVNFPGGFIPKSQMDPNSLAYMKLFPAPNADPAKNSTGSNYQFFEGPPQNRWEYRLRGDYNISQKTKLFFSWNMQREGTSSPISIWWQIPGSLPYPSSQTATQKSDIYSANLVHVFTPTLTNEFVFAQANFLNPIKLGNPDAVNPDKIGFKMTGLFANPFLPQIPNTYGWSNANVGFATYPYGAPWPSGGAASFGKLSQTPNISDNITKIAGKHTVKAGFYWDFARNNQTGGGLDGSTQGAAAFENWGARSTGNPLSDWITGRITTFRQMKDAPVTDFKYYQYSFFVNDQWKATKRLTLTLGMRFEHMGNWVPAEGPGLAVWNQSSYNNASNAPGWTGLQWTAVNKSIPMSGFPSRPMFYEPRFGAAYDLFGDGKTVLRGGIGLYRYQLSYNSVSGAAYSAPLNVPDVSTNWGCCVGWNEFKQYSPATGVPGLGSSLNGALNMDDDRTPHTWTYNFTISRRMPWRSVAEAQYSGNKSRDLMLRGPLSNINLVPFGAFFKPNPRDGKIYDPADGGFPSNDYRPLRNYQDVTLINHGSYSNYNSLVLTWQKQTGRATFTTNYTFSKVLGVRDNQSDNGPGAGTTLWPFGLRQNYGVLGWDHTHIYNAAYVFNSPNWVKGNKVLQGIANGWVLSGITQMQSGAPIQPNTSGTLNASWPGDYTPQRILGTNAVSNMFPKVLCDPRSNLQSGQYFNPSCFGPAPAGANGDIIWPYIKGPAFFNSDLAMYKNFNINEQHKIQLRFSAFNFMNHPLPQFGAGGNSDLQLNFNNNGTLSKTNLNKLTWGGPNFTVGRRVVEFTIKYNF
ncbi:MAG: TonB-dependent receptor [Acidobacteria bacterium]|nr:TonB-dependent receptor [Acidobacteriota bacterium]